MKLKQQEQLRRFITNLQPPKKYHIALKLNRLKDKRMRYEPHKDFRSQFISEELMPKDLKLETEPTIRDFDQEFVHGTHNSRASLLS